MKKNSLLIHDLPQGFGEQGGFDEIVSDNQTIKNCIGCFSCWIKTPMKCVLKDDYAHMAEKLKNCNELTIVSHCLYGGPSPFIKNVLDRSIPYLHPDFVIKDGRMHHKQRFSQHISLKMMFYGEDLSEKEKRTAEKWTHAMAVNFDFSVSDILFYEDLSALEGDLLNTENGYLEEPLCSRSNSAFNMEGIEQKEESIALINGSPKKKYSTSGSMLEDLKGLLAGSERIEEILIQTPALDETQFEAAAKCETLVFSFPLYVDGVPSHLLQTLTDIEAAFAGRELLKSVYAIINCGFYEGEHTESAMEIIENWCIRCGFTFCGGLGVGAGGMWHSIKDVPAGKGPKKTYGRHLQELAERIEKKEVHRPVFTTVDFPRLAYKKSGEFGWKKAAQKNGINL